jgi:heme/copper-type cytochrome/quinol oxidase subunit 2
MTTTDIPSAREPDLDNHRPSRIAEPGPTPPSAAADVVEPPHQSGAGGSAVGGEAGESPVPRKRHGYQDAGEVSGRPVAEAGYWLALLVIAGADLAAFYQVVGVVNPTGQWWLIWLLVAGFTAGSLTLAHFAGRVARDRTAGHGAANWWMVIGLAAPWLILGIIAFFVRGIKASSATAATAEEAEILSKQELAAAIMFLVLYIASGVITFFGVYLTRNPLRVAYRRALRAHRKALKRLAVTQPPYERAVQVVKLHARNRKREPMNFAAASAQRMAFADELKRYSAARMAILLKSPSTTDGMTLPDRRPLHVPKPEPVPETDNDPAAASADNRSQKTE